MRFTIEMSRRVEVNTDPQRRCYNGCHARSEIRQLPWEQLELGLEKDKAEERLRCWRELSAYAVSQRGEEARTDYRIVPDEVTDGKQTV